LFNHLNAQFLLEKNKVIDELQNQVESIKTEKAELQTQLDEERR